MSKCEGFPGWECGRPVSGRELWCIVHGDAEHRSARWEARGKRKEDMPPEPRGMPVASARDLALALQGELL